MTATQQAEQQTAQHSRGGASASKSASDNGASASKTAGKSRARADSPPPVNSKALCEIVVNKLFGKRHWAAEWVMELCAADPHFPSHLADQRRGYAHYLCVLRLALSEQDAGGKDAAECARIIRTTSKKKLLKAWFPSCPAGFIKVLPKLPRTLLHETEYRCLIHAFADKSKRKRFSHAEQLSMFDIQLPDMMKILPAQFQLGAAHCEDVDDYEQLCMLIEGAKRLNMEITEREFGEAVKMAECMNDLRLWLARRALKMPFPPPPWEGDDKIRPLRSRHELNDAVAQFKNCAKDYVLKVVAGYSHLYVCKRPLAMIEITNDVFFGWMVSQIEGPKRKSLSPIQAFEIKRAFYNAGICQTEMGADDFGNVAGELRYARRPANHRARGRRRSIIDDI